MLLNLLLELPLVDIPLSEWPSLCQALNASDGCNRQAIQQVVAALVAMPPTPANGKRLESALAQITAASCRRNVVDLVETGNPALVTCMYQTWQPPLAEEPPDSTEEFAAACWRLTLDEAFLQRMIDCVDMLDSGELLSVRHLYRRLGRVVEAEFDAYNAVIKSMQKFEQLLADNDIDAASAMLPAIHTQVKNGLQQFPDSVLFAKHQWRLFMARGNVAFAQGDLMASAACYEESRRTAEALSQSTGKSLFSLYDMALSWKKLGDVWLVYGNLADAAAFYGEARQLYEQAVERTRRSICSLQNLAVALEYLGDVKLAQGNAEGARQMYADKLRLGDELVQKTQGSIQSVKIRLTSWLKLGNLEKSTGNFKTAVEFYTRALASSEELCMRTQRARACLNDRLLVLSQLGDVRLDQYEMKTAGEMYDRCQHIAEELGVSSGWDSRALDQYWVLLNRMGTVWIQQGNLAAAADIYEKACVIAEKLVHKSKRSCDSLQKLSSMLCRLGDVRKNQGQEAVAVVLYHRGHLVFEEFVEQTQRSIESFRNLDLSLKKLAFICRLQAGPRICQQLLEKGYSLCHDLHDTAWGCTPHLLDCILEFADYAQFCGLFTIAEQFLSLAENVRLKQKMGTQISEY